jgi:hypothetical protein
MSTSPTAAAAARDSPFVGLTPYSDADRGLFFGREAEVRLLTHAAIAAKLTLVYGPGGVGKSSVLLAGVVPELRERGARRRNEDGGPELVPVVFRSWSGGAFELRHAVARALGDAGSERWDTRSLADVVEAVTESARTRVVVVLDQLEEYFVYRASHGDTFVAELAECLARPRLRASFVLSIREDALGRLDEFTERIPQVFENAIRLENLSGDSARRAIVEPIASVGAAIEAELVEAVIDQTAVGEVRLGSPGPGSIADRAAAELRVEPAYLQIVMGRLWTDASEMESPVLRRELLERLGGAGRIVGSYLDDALEALPPEELAIAAELLRFLVTPSGVAVAYTGSDLASYVERPLGKIESVLNELAHARILRAVAPSTSASETGYEIFHGALAPAVLSWRARFEEAQARARVELGERELRRARTRVGLLVGGLVAVVVVETILLLVTR